MDVFKIFAILIASLLGTAECYCHISGTLLASTYNKYQYVKFYNNDYCTINIRTYSYGYSNYYLQISWSSFSVNGEIPTCSEEYVQVYLTSSYKSIGKFCSNNSTMPFTMYSHDGYAKIVYKADSSTNGYFSFQYELKSKTSEKLGDGYLNSCMNTYQSLFTGQVFSSNWPQQYSSLWSPCLYTIYRPSAYDVTKIVFMDLNLNSVDCIELRGSNISSSYMTYTIDTRICSSSSIKTYTVYDRYIQIKFNRRYGSSSYRGFVAGYVSYNLKMPTPAPATTTLFATFSTEYKYVAYDNNDYHTIYIRPASGYSSSKYYLQISWSSFNVKGEMPSCTKDYVQVYLTKSNKSIGKFCSNNAASPFTMYSYDGYAKIIYKADSSTNGYFGFRYGLGSKYLSSCMKKYQSIFTSGVFSSNWPQQYSPLWSPCLYTIYRSSSYDVTKIVFMDLNLNLGDCIELRGSNTSSSYWKHTIDPRICSTSSIKTYTVYDRYIQIKFNRKYGSSSSNRGFVAGYVSYNLSTAATPLPGTTLLSATSASGYKYVSYLNNDYHTIYITPSSGYNSSKYYLQISWPSFNVIGDMPSCASDYVQVFLTRSYKSIGKFCANNAASPFTMYSHDGYAKIVYKADSSINGYFAFRYQMKSALLEDGYAPCPGTNKYGSSSTVYSRRWPETYFSSSFACIHTIYRSSLYDVIKIIFMDLDLNPSPYHGDCIQLRGSNTSSSYMTHTIDTRICSTSSIKTYTIYDRYIQIKFHRRHGIYSRRGFVAGYVSYGQPKRKTDSSSSTIAATTAIKILIPLIVVGVVVFVFLKYRARMRACRANRLAGGVAAPTQQTNITATSTETTNAVINGDSAATTYPPSGYPKSTDSVASSAPPSYLVASAYPLASAPYPNQSYPPPAYEFTANPTSDGTVPVYPSYPTGNFGYPTKNAGDSTRNPAHSSGNPGYPTGKQEFPTGIGGYLTGNQEFPTGIGGYLMETNTASITLPPISNQGVTFSSHGDQQQPIVPPIDQNNDVPNVPPPAYPSAP